MDAPHLVQKLAMVIPFFGNARIRRRNRAQAIESRASPAAESRAGKPP
jgi:hypothetical protein